MENRIHQSVSRGALARMIQRMARDGAQLHSMVLYEKGERLIRFALPPYACTDRRELYSLSKSFCVTAAGVAFDQGKLSPEDRVLDWFGEYAPLCAGDERWQRMKLRHVMSMSTGHAACVMPPMCRAEDSMRAFFEQKLSYEPGERFVYNTGATCVIAEVVRRAMGMNAAQVLAQHVFPALGIGEFDWKQNLDGRCQGGVGLSLSCDEVARLGLLYLNEGEFDGKRVLSRAWTRMASGKQMDNAGNGTPDWCAGYGFQFWRNACEGFRGDGARGQLCVVLPGKQIVAAVLAEATDMQKELSALLAFAQEMHETEEKDAPLPDGYAPQGTLAPGAYDSGWRRLRENKTGLHSVRVQKDETTVTLTLLDARGVQQVKAPAGAWQENMLSYPHFLPTLRELVPREQPQALRFAACARTEESALVIACRSLNTPHVFDWRVEEMDGKLRLSIFTPQDVFGEEKLLEEM